MSNRVSGRNCHAFLALAKVAVISMSLAGCSSLGTSFSDPTTTGSTSGSYVGDKAQAMPQQLSTISPNADTASARYLPPGYVGGSPAADQITTASITAPIQQPVTTTTLPPLKASSPVGSPQTMPQQVPFQTASQTPAAVKAAPDIKVASNSGYTHIIESGESLYAIARKYKVSTQTLVDANGLGSPDKIYVGQKLTIPGVTGVPAPQKIANDTIQTAALTPKPVVTAPEPAPKITQVAAAPVKAVATPQDAAKPLPIAAPRMPAAKASGSKFRWPVSGKIVTDFAASKGTGINIDVPEGTAVRASETGTVIYVGDAVEGYGNLILLKHDNGFVSAYAHLSQFSVSKGATVQRGDAIGLAGMTGSVSRPQLHFELRKGATPVDPIPHLAS